jgi:hypothetical protein
MRAYILADHFKVAVGQERYEVEMNLGQPVDWTRGPGDTWGVYVNKAGEHIYVTYRDEKVTGVGYALQQCGK